MIIKFEAHVLFCEVQYNLKIRIVYIIRYIYNKKAQVKLSHAYNFLAAEALGVKDLVPSYHDIANLQTKDLETGLCFASGGSGYDPLSSKINVLFYLLLFLK